MKVRSWREAAEFMLKSRVSAVPVVDDAGQLVGILSEKDLFRALFPTYQEWTETPNGFHDFEQMEKDAADAAGKPVASVMSTRLITAAPDTPVLKIGALMVASGIHQVPVVNRGRLLGMVGRGEIYKAILENYFGLSR
jgi:CBS domain-containing protein